MKLNAISARVQSVDSCFDDDQFRDAGWIHSKAFTKLTIEELFKLTYSELKQEQKVHRCLQLH